MELVERLKNKVSYHIYKTVNDDEANQYIEEKKEKEEKEEKEKEEKKEEKKDEKKEQYNDTPPNAVASTDKPGALNKNYIIAKIQNLASYFWNVLFIPLLAIIVASFVANELIIYPAGVRLVFFIFTVVICCKTIWVTYVITGFYFLKWLYQKYINRDKPDPPIRIMPTIFATLPLFVENPNDGGFMKAIKSPFTYLKEENAGIKNSLKTKTVIDPKTGEEREIADGPTEKELLDGLMENYRSSLTDSFPFYETAKKSNQIFNEREVQLEEYFKTMHERPQLKNTNSNANEAPLPPVINQNKQANEFVQQVKANQKAATQFLAPPVAPAAPPVAPVAPEAAPPVAPEAAPPAPPVEGAKEVPS